jgi:hypothetical protein
VERPIEGAYPWCAVTPHPSGWCFAWSVNGKVKFEFANGAKLERSVPTDFLRYLDAASNPAGEIVAIGVGADDYAYVVRSQTATVEKLGKVVGNFAVALFWNGHDFVTFRTISPTRYLEGTVEKPIPIGQTSQGFRQIRSTGEIVWGDSAMVKTIGGRTIHKYSSIGKLWTGQRDGPDHIDLHDEQAGSWWTPVKGSAQPPRIAQLSSSLYGVCAGTNHGAVLAIGPPWPALIPDVVIPPTEPPMPAPVPNLKHIVERVRVKYPTPLGSTHAAFLLELAPALSEESKLKIGLLKKTGGTVIKLPDGTTVSQDVVAVHQTTELWTYDTLDSGETVARPAWRRTTPTGIDTNLSRFYAVTAPPPPTGTHKYVGGGNDTGICDECGLSRFDPIHITPTSKLPHLYDGGEQDTGLCDECQKSFDDPIHTGTQPPGNCQEWIDKVSRLTAENERLTAQNEVLLAEVNRLLAENERLREELEQGQKPCTCKLEGNATIIRLFGITCTPVS